MKEKNVGSRPQVWPVIHLKSPGQAMANARLADQCGCPGIFLISMDGQNDMIDPVAAGIRSRLPDLKIGVNYLGMRADLALKQSLEEGHDATWTDDAGIHSEAPSDTPARCMEILDDAPRHLFFAAVAFKYQKAEPDPPRAARIAADFGFIPTTSGSATGSAPPATKLAAMRAALGVHPLAVASGITPENVGDLGIHLSHILVATGISRTFHDFDDDKLRALMAALPLRNMELPNEVLNWPNHRDDDPALSREIRAAFFDSNVPRKNVALRKAYDALTKRSVKE